MTLAIHQKKNLIIINLKLKKGYNMDAYKMMQRLLDQGFTAEELLNELIQAMSEKESRENFEFIARMHDINLETNEGSENGL